MLKDSAQPVQSFEAGDVFYGSTKRYADLIMMISPGFLTSLVVIAQLDQDESHHCCIVTPADRAVLSLREKL
jgi:hypothetical protein